MTVELLPQVRFRHIPKAFIALWEALVQAGQDQNTVPTITGAAYEDYAPGGYHDKGYAWDVRIHDIPDPLLYACTIRFALKDIDKRYRIVYGDSDHTDHIHIEFRYDQKIKSK